MEPYWEAGEDRIPASLKSLWRDYKVIPASQKRLFLRAHPEEAGKLRKFEDITETERKKMRVRTPVIDVALVKWLGYSPMTSKGNREFQKKIQPATPTPTPTRKRITLKEGAERNLVGAK